MSSGPGFIDPNSGCLGFLNHQQYIFTTHVDVNVTLDLCNSLIDTAVKITDPPQSVRQPENHEHSSLCRPFSRGLMYPWMSRTGI